MLGASTNPHTVTSVKEKEAGEVMDESMCVGRASHFGSSREFKPSGSFEGEHEGDR